MAPIEQEVIIVKSVKKWFVLILALALVLGLLGACNGNSGGGGGGGSTPSTPSSPPTSSGGGGAPATIKIGVPNPFTGGLAPFGLGSPETEQLVETYVNDVLGGIYIEEFDTNIPIELIFVDTESSDTKAAEQTQQLISNNDISIMIARHTPGTALPVSAMSENLATPFVSLECPVDPWLAGGPYEWGYHSFWYVESCAEVHMGMWEAMGYGPGSVVGPIFPDDPDGNAWAPVYREMIQAAGYTYIDPGPTEMMAADWTNVINQFKQGGVQIVTGIPITPDMASFCTQAIQQGFDFEIASTGRGTLFPAAMETFPEELIDKFFGEVWWSPYHPWASSLTGMTAKELGDWWEDEIGDPWSQVIGFKYAGVEIAVDALIRAASLDPATIRDAIAATDMETMIGRIKYDPSTRIAETMLVGGSWSHAGNRPDGSPIAQLDIVYNDSYPAVPLTGELKRP